MKTMKNTIAVLIFACCLPAAGYCEPSGSPAGEAARPVTADLQYLFNAYSSFADEYFGSVLFGLKLLATTSDVRSGKWEAMKDLLAEFDRSGIASAAVWYALPDGNYYTAKDGRTGKTLSDRPYFPGLISGKEVVGDLVISRSTGKRTAVFAVPVLSDGKVTGALGVSLSVEVASRTLDRKMGLPPGYVFYALDKDRRISLHGKPELLFEYPSEFGAESLNAAIDRMMSEKEGRVEYEFQGRKTVYFRRSPLTGWVYGLGVVTAPGQ